MEASDMRERPSRYREPLQDTTERVNNHQPSTSRRPSDSRSAQMPHHESLWANGNLQIRNNPASPISNAENKRLSAITNESQKKSNRDSQISNTSTNTSTTSRRKTHVGPWQLGKTLGKGASGRVRKARHMLTGQAVAIKIVSKNTTALLRTKSLADMDIMNRGQVAESSGNRLMPFGIEREVVIMKLIDHPNIISLYDVWENRGELYLVLEYIEGGELFKHIISNGFLDEPEAVHIFRQMIAGLSYCHLFGICHRDLKPENILLDRNRDVKIADFGMAALQPANRWLKSSCGSPHYASPEVIRGERYSGDRADVWSCGVILFAMLAGRLPFESRMEDFDENCREVLTLVQAGEYTLPGNLTPEAKDLIWRILQPDPSQRISMQQMWEHPLLRRYEALDRNPEVGPPPPLTVVDCGERIQHRMDIDAELLRNLQNLWHGSTAEELAIQLLNDKPNHEKIIYAKLLKFKEEQLENYQGPPIEYSKSDYHHVQRKMSRRTSTRLNAQGPGPHRSVSKYSILNEGSAGQRYRRRPSTAATEESYDPFRPSRTQIPKSQADYARVTVLKRPSNSSVDRHPSIVSSNRRAPSNAASARNGRRTGIQGADAYSMHSSPPPLPYGSNEQIERVKRGLAGSYHGSRPSLASSPKDIRKSVSYKRGVSFTHTRKRSTSVQQMPVTIPHKPSPLNLQQRQIGDLQLKTSSSTPSPTTIQSPQISTPPVIRSRKEKTGINQAGQLTSRKARIASHYWKEDARKVSSELEKVCDEAFKDRFSMASSTATAFTAATDPPDRIYESPATSLSVRENSRTLSAITPDRDAKDKLQQRPLPMPPSSELIGSYNHRELSKTMDLLKQRAADTPGLDDLIAHVNRLMQPNMTGNYEDQRAVSTSVPKPELGRSEYEVDNLSGAARVGYRSASEPLQRSAATNMRMTRERLDDGSTIRMVTDNQRPISPIRPLTIRKRSGASTPSDKSVPIATPQEQQLRFVSDTMATNDHRSYGQEDRRSTGVTFDKLLDPIAEDEDKEYRESKEPRPHSGESKRGWFRRHTQAQRSRDSDKGPPPPLKNDIIPQDYQRIGTIEGQPIKRVSGTPSQESQKSEPNKEKETSSGKGKFFKMFSKLNSKESRKSSEVVSGGYGIDDGASEDTSTHSQQTYMSGALQNVSATSVAHPSNNNKKSNLTFQTPPPRAIQPYHQNWFARFLRIKPAVTILCFQVSKARARKEIASTLREWRKYGMRDVTVDRETGRIWARVAEKNSLHIRPVSLACELFTVLQHGRKANLSIARFSQEKGAKSSFEKVLGGLEEVLVGRGCLVRERERCEGMRKVLGG